MKIFVLLSRVPYPIEKGDKLRAFHQIRCLAQNHEIVLCALSDSEVNPDAVKVLGEFCSEIHILPLRRAGMVWNVVKAFFNGKPIQVGYFYRCSVRKKVNKIIEKCSPDHIFCQLTRVSEYVKDSRIPKTLDYQDVFSMGAKRRAENSSFLMKMIFMMEYRRLRHYEHYIFGKFDHKTIISEPDRDLLPHTSRNEVVVIPNGVDHEYFSPVKGPKTHDIVFTGNMGYPPNIDAARFMAEEIFPLVLRQIPGAKLLLAGATPHARILALQSENITVTGWLEDIRSSYATSRIFIAPMRIGTGLQNKLLEAMPMELPCITSVLANQALGAKENEEILIGTTTREYADHIIHLLQNETYARTLAAKGHTFVRKIFSWENSTAQLERLFTAGKKKESISANQQER
ncbi:MAG: glycosyltransferase [Bacteroidota bacterium]